MKNHIQPTNYCTHAIDDIRRWANDHAATMPVSAERALKVSGMLERAVKFMLPNCAELLDKRTFGETHLELLRLPYPVTAFEAPWMEEEKSRLEMPGFPLCKSTRRLTLCWEAHEDTEMFPGLNEISAFFGGEGVFTMPIYYLDDHRCWSLSGGGMFVPRDFHVDPGVEVSSATQLVDESVQSSIRNYQNAYRFRAEFFTLLPELFDQLVVTYGGDKTRALASIQVEGRGGFALVWPACTVLNCANVGTTSLVPNPALNAKRSAAGKPPLFTYKVLQVLDERGPAGVHTGVTHASPRTHLRRGHIKHRNGKNIYTRPTIVNAGSLIGTIEKNYTVGKRRNPGTRTPESD
ncbi:hypothetical protein [Paraburkholderia phenazinium]|uniref:hypothetical protein n=1 Tax=Paraburkholderia phenazinium TaxID=60549 RepID=UPI00158B0DC8|nr:hypothetical protein [Paraburkholderia phenazinium]